MDMKNASEGDVSSFPSPDELWEKTFGNVETYNKYDETD